MKITHGIWEVETGKGDRHYIKSNNQDPIMNGGENVDFGMYGYQHLQDLAIAILKFENKQNEANSITTKLQEVKNET